jgi:manganese efflux pump family protein
MLLTLLKVAVLAIALGLDALAVSISIGLTGPTPRQSARVVAVFAGTQILLAAVGLLIGSTLGRALAPATGVAAALLLVGLGVLTVRGAVTEKHASRPSAPVRLTSGVPLITAAFTVSLDALAVGLTLPVLGAPVLLSLAAIAVAGVALCGAGLTFGSHLGSRAGPGAEGLAGGLLALTGLFVLAQALGHG